MGMEFSPQQISDNVAKKLMKNVRGLFGFFKKRDRHLAGQLGKLPIDPDVVEGYLKLKKARKNELIQGSAFLRRVNNSYDVLCSLAQMYNKVPEIFDDVLGIESSSSGEAEVIDTHSFYSKDESDELTQTEGEMENDTEWET